MSFWRIPLYPVSLLYGAIVSLRNLLFDLEILRQYKSSLPTISVGNLTAGGTGKSPHIEYLIRLIGPSSGVATLSRGYKRSSKGFVLATTESTTSEVGDEPRQFKQKFPSATVAVDEKRRRGMIRLEKECEGIKLVLLDDAFQHRAVKPGINILLTDYFNPYFDDFLIPSGLLREPKKGARRADIIIVTKTPKVLSPFIRQSFNEKIKPLPHQKLFFSYIKYASFVAMNPVMDDRKPGKKINTIMLVVGIANTYPIEDYLRQQCYELVILKYPDHHSFSPKDIGHIKNSWDNIVSSNKFLVTTEKDAMRLNAPHIREMVVPLPFYYLPIEVEFHEEDKQRFNKLILNYVGENRPGV